MIRQSEFVNRGGHILRGICNIPDEEQKSTVVVNIHGFGGNKSGYKNMHVQMARALEREGIACVRFDLYGNGESDGEFAEMTFTTMLQDVEDICTWVRRQPWAKRNSIILSGQSLGGYVASCAAPKVQPAALVLMCPGASMWQGALERVEAMEAQGIYSADIEGLRFSTAFNRDMHKYEPYTSAKGYEGPVLLIRGTKDELVDEHTCEQYREVYGKACKYIPIEGANHNFASIPARLACERAIVDFVS